MLSKQLDNQSWLLADGDTTFLATAFYNAPMLHVSIGVIEGDVVDLSTVVIKYEVWGGQINTVQMQHTMSSLLHSFAMCANHLYPFELAFEWGGQLYHRNVATSGYYLAQHAGTVLQ